MPKYPSTRIGSAALACLALGAAAGCIPPPGPVVASSDSTPPAATFSLSHTPSGAASTGTLQLVSRSGPLYFSATGKDPETGVQDVQIWVTTKSTYCDAELCTSSGPGLLGAPMWTSTSPKKNPGEVMTPNSVLIQWIELSTAGLGPPPPGGFVSRTWIAWAVVKNNLGMTTRTPSVEATWSASA